MTLPGGRWLILAGSSAGAAKRYARQAGLDEFEVLTLDELIDAGPRALALLRRHGAPHVAIHTLAWPTQRHARLLELALAIVPASRRWILDESAARARRARRPALAAAALLLPSEALAAAMRAGAEAARFLVRRGRGARPAEPEPGALAVLAVWLGEPGTAVGGSVSHAAGILGAFRQVGARVGLVARGPVPEQLAAAVDDIEPVRGLAPGARLSRDLHALALNARVRQAARRLAGRLQPTFVYQRHGAYLVAGADVAERLGIPLVLEWNGSQSWTRAHWQRRLPLEARLAPLLAAVERDVARRANLIVAVSDEAARMAVEAGAQPGRVAVVPNGVDLDATERARATASPGGSPGARLGWIGSFGPWHGAEVLVRAAAALGPGVETILIGEGHERGRCEVLARELGARVRFTGSLPHDEALVELAACDILVSPHVPLPDTAFFGSPTKLFEYMALERPIVASELGQIGDVLVHGRTAELVAPGDPAALAEGIRRVLAREDRGRSLGLAAREEAERSHSWKRRAVDILERLECRGGHALDRPTPAREPTMPSAGATVAPVSAALLGRVLGSTIVRQAALFAGSAALVGLLATAVRALLARSLEPDQFGAFAFAASALLLLGGLFEFGLLLPAARAAARESLSGRRAIAGAALLLYLPIGVAFAATVFGLSHLVDGMFNVEAGAALRATAPLALVYPFQQLALWLAQGVERLHLYSISAALGQLLFAATVAALLAGRRELTVELALVAQGAAFIVGWLPLVALLRPHLAAGAQRVRGLVSDARSYGFHVYVGRVLSIGTYNMDVLLVAALADARSVGLYAIAATLARGVGLPTQGIANALFGRLTRDGRLERRWLVAAWAVGLTVAAALTLVGASLVELLFSDRYAVGAALIGPLALAEAVRGVTTLYNNALTAQARGRELRNAGLALTVANVALSLSLIPAFGAAGAAWASFGALTVNLAAHMIAYRRRLAPARGAGAALPAA